MLTDARSLPEGSALECDLCIIGAGAAGLAIADALVDAGLSILVLEAGGEKTTADSQSFLAGETRSAAHPDPALYRQRRLGGATAIWGGRCVPLDPIDFEARPWVPRSGWPINRATLDPYYERAQDLLDAGEFDYAASSALPPGELIEGLAAPGVSTDAIERFSLPTDMWRRVERDLRMAPDIRVLSNAACLRLDTFGGGGLVERAEIADPEGRRFTVRAARYVVAGGGIESYRLLASSGPGERGLGDHSGRLGRTYMCHVEVAAGDIVLDDRTRPVSFGFERTRDGVYARRRIALTAERQRELGIMNAMVRLHHANVLDPAHRDPILSLMYLAKNTVIPEYRRKLSMVEHAAGRELVQDAAFWRRHVTNVVRGAPRAAAFAGNWLLRRSLARRKLPYVALRSAVGRYAVDMNIEQQPNPDSRVLLSDVRDRHGMRRVAIDWRVTDLDVATVVGTYAELDRALRTSGVGRLDYDAERLADHARAAPPVGGHHIGTARMSADPADGVVDADCRVHGSDNLYVAGAAVFPTSGHANPTLTLVALALRLSDHLRQARAS